MPSHMHMMLRRTHHQAAASPRHKAWVAALLLAIVACSPARAASLQIVTENTPPGSMEQNGRVVGYATDIVREIMLRTYTDYTLRIFPWKRAYAMALETDNACVFSTARTAEREALFKWVGPLEDNEWVLFARTDRKLRINSLDDVRGMRIGTSAGDARETYLVQRGLQVESISNNADNPGKLVRNRIDLWASSLKWGTAAIERAGLAGQIVPVLTFNRVKIYLACNPKVPTELVESMNAAVKAMEKDGSSAAIIRRYAGWLAVPQ
jgi:polar amino acid transport system substrate-binding protein